jgi:predicted nucleic acid-binding protein
VTSTVFLDTNALYGSDFADTLLSVADEQVFDPRWSADVLTELRRNLVQKAGISGSYADRRIKQMQRAFPRAEVKGYEDLIAKMTNDPKDRHVLAAAVKSGARELVTFNLNDFPPQSTRPHGVKIVHPDDFLLSQLSSNPRGVLKALEQQIGRAKKPPLTSRQLLDRLARAGAPKFAADVRKKLGPAALLDAQAPARGAAKAPAATPEPRRDALEPPKARGLLR